MTFHLGFLVLLAALGAPGARAAAAPERFEILVFDELPGRLGLELGTEECQTRMRSATRPGPRFVVRAADVESYIWKTQRITLTREASARLAAAGQELMAGRDSTADPDRVGWMGYRVFEARLDGERLYGGFFADPWSGRTCPLPVIHPEWVEGRVIFYLLPVNMFPGQFGALEETVGASRFWMRLARPSAPAAGEGAERERDPILLKFRPVLRDARVRALFERLGKLVPEPLPPSTPEEIRLALAQTDAAVHTWIARGSTWIEPVLKEDYVLRVFDRYTSSAGKRRSPSDSWEDRSKREILDSMTAREWSLPFYAVLAAEPPETTGERRATLRSLVAMRGRRGAQREIDRIVISTRHYVFNPPAWQLVDETETECADDSPGPWRLPDQAEPAQLDPCWPPRR